jgi:predicted Zn finger-like uncharacterized protein
MAIHPEWDRQQRVPEPAESDANAPTKCPACQSAALTTASKSPDRESYWRCTACGEVWNPSRVRTTHTYRGSR